MAGPENASGVVSQAVAAEPGIDLDGSRATREMARATRPVNNAVERIVADARARHGHQRRRPASRTADGWSTRTTGGNKKREKSTLLGAVVPALLATAIGALPGIHDASGADSDRTMTIVRIYTGADGRSHFEDVAVPLKDGGKVGFLSERIQVKGVLFRITEGDYNYDFHTAPRRQYVVNLEGEVEIEVGDGTKRILRTGDVLLAEDTTGQGHISRAVNGKPRRSLFITLEE